MKVIVLFLIMAAVTMFAFDELNNRAPPKIIYRYLPRDLDAYLRDVPFTVYDYSKIFQDGLAPVTQPPTS
jgi:hypothetical protein